MLRCSRYGGAVLGVALGHVLGRLCGDTSTVSGAAACGVGTKCLPYDASSRPLVCDDPCVRVLSCVCVLFLKNLLGFFENEA